MISAGLMDEPLRKPQQPQGNQLTTAVHISSLDSFPRGSSTSVGLLMNPVKQLKARGPDKALEAPSMLCVWGQRIDEKRCRFMEGKRPHACPWIRQWNV
jgi:hypothetical protein